MSGWNNPIKFPDNAVCKTLVEAEEEFDYYGIEDGIKWSLQNQPWMWFGAARALKHIDTKYAGRPETADELDAEMEEHTDVTQNVCDQIWNAYDFDEEDARPVQDALWEYALTCDLDEVAVTLQREGVEAAYKAFCRVDPFTR